MFRAGVTHGELEITLHVQNPCMWSSHTSNTNTQLLCRQLLFSLTALRYDFVAALSVYFLFKRGRAYAEKHFLLNNLVKFLSATLKKKDSLFSKRKLAS